MIFGLFKTKNKEWYSHPTFPQTIEDQLAWRRAVDEIDLLLGERELPRCCGKITHLPNENTFTCDCGEPTNEILCSLCLAEIP